MKKAITFWAWLTLQIAILMIVGMMMTYVNDALQKSGFFGDTHLSVKSSDDNIDSWYTWGNRHYWYFWLMIILFILSLIRIGIWIQWFWDGNNKQYN